jgi:hypothetical protein
MGSAVKKVTGTVTKGLFGGSGSSSPGVLGTGRFQADPRKVSEEPFKRALVGEGSQEELRQKQQAQTTRLEERAEGKAPSIAEAQLKQATNRSLKQQLAGAQARKGGSASLKERELARAAAGSRQEIAEQAAISKLQEQQLAEQSLASQLQQQRAQDINIAESDRASAQALESLLTQQDLGAKGINLSGFQSAAQQRSGLVSGVGQGLSSMAMLAASDEDVKKNVKREMPKLDIKEPPKPPEKKESKGPDLASVLSLAKKAGPAAASDKYSKKNMVSDKAAKKNVKSDANPKSFLDALTAYSYEYKEPEKPGRGKGRHMSVMAQDLEKAGPVGKSMVLDTPNGKMVDYGKGFGAMLANQAHLNERLKKMEKKKS